MIKLYTTKDSLASRAAKEWLHEQGLNYVEQDISEQRLGVKEIKEILVRTENGTTDILLTEQVMTQMSEDALDAMTLIQLITLIQKNPHVLKCPILIEGNKLQVGYDEEEMRVFLRVRRRRVM